LEFFSVTGLILVFGLGLDYIIYMMENEKGHHEEKDKTLEPFAIMLSFIYQVREMNNGIWLVWIIFIGSWISDTAAYCVGMLIGKHKLSPIVSPKKSIEGSIGGIVGSALVGAIYAICVKSKLDMSFNPIIAFSIISAASSVISQIGDLAASAIKRKHDIKDYGTLIPGHGGILDRFDSVIFTAPIVYYLATFFMA
jgi:phosphatidate cytidylyltransferase